MNTFGERLYRLRKESKLARDALGLKINVSKTAVKNWEDGDNLPKIEHIQELAKLFKVDFNWFLTGQGDKNKYASVEVKPVPVVSWVVAGSWAGGEPVSMEDLDDMTKYLPRPFNLSSEGFALQVRGESMKPDFEPGDYIYVEPRVDVSSLANGSLVVVREGDNNEATFKQLVLGNTSEDMYLRPLNKDWHEQKMTPKSEWHLVGKVIGKWVEYS